MQMRSALGHTVPGPTPVRAQSTLPVRTEPSEPGPLIRDPNMAEHIPKWAAVPERTGRLYLEMVAPSGSAPKHDSERWCVDRKAGYLLGRNADAVDVAVDHKSASRVHACLAHGPEGELHLLDLGSVHGACLGL
jgi:hypothetical protein